MTAVISYFVAAISIVTLLILWFLNVHKVLSRKKEDILRAQDHVRLHREGCSQMRGSPNEKTAARMLETSKKIYLQIEKSYRETLKKPLYLLPGLLMGFRMAENNRENGVANRMIYFCKECGFVFCRTGEIGECPYCGKKRIRPATEEEDEQLRPFLERKNSELGINEE